jgi:TonB family protein
MTRDNVAKDELSLDKKLASQQKNNKQIVIKPIVNTTNNMMETSRPQEEAVHLIGDKHTPAKPLMKLIGKALTAHLIYPSIAKDFNVKGSVLVGFLLHPNGEVTEAQLIHSSGAQVLDQAALTGVKTMSPINNVSPYVKQPRFLIIGILFR